MKKPGNDKYPSLTPSLISKECTINGIVESKAFMQIDGIIKGNIFIGEKLIVGKSAVIEGDIQSKEIIIYGTINGSIKAESINIKNSGKVFGSFNTSSLQIEKGAVYIGSITMNKSKP